MCRWVSWGIGENVESEGRYQRLRLMQPLACIDSPLRDRVIALLEVFRIGSYLA
jgi:hypothetical protein